MDEFEEKLLEAFSTIARRSVATEAAAALDPNPLASWQVDFKALFDGEHEDEQWLLEPILARGRAHALYAGAKVGKSWVCLYLAAALATGRAVLRRPAGTPVHVLYVDFEMTPADLADRLEDFGYGPDDAELLNEHLHYVLLPSIPALDTEEGGELLAKAAVATGAELVVIDTMMRAVEGEENSSDTFNAFYRNTGLRLKALGVTWARLDHAGKDPTKGQRGSSAKDGDVDLVLRLERVEGGVTVKATHRRIGWYPEVTQLAVSSDWPIGITMHGGDDHLWAEGTKETADLLDRLGVPSDATVRTAAKALREAGHKASQKLISDGLRWRRDLRNTLRNSEVSFVCSDDSVTLRNNPSDLGVTPSVTLRNTLAGQVRNTPHPVRVGVTQPPVSDTVEVDLEDDPW